MNIMAIDQARKGAWSIWDYKKQQLIATGVFEFQSNSYSFADAVTGIEDIVNMVVKAYKVKFITIEDINLRFNVKTFKELAQLQGVLVNYCRRNNILYALVQPASWQSFCGARGRSVKEIQSHVTDISNTTKKQTKILSIQFVKDNYGIDTLNDNLADAVCLGHYTVNKIDTTKSEDERKIQNGKKKRK